jgi:hypothetical protein
MGDHGSRLIALWPLIGSKKVRLTNGAGHSQSGPPSPTMELGVFTPKSVPFTSLRRRQLRSDQDPLCAAFAVPPQKVDDTLTRHCGLVLAVLALLEKRVIRIEPVGWTGTPAAVLRGCVDGWQAAQQTFADPHKWGAAPRD